MNPRFSQTQPLSFRFHRGKQTSRALLLAGCLAVGGAALSKAAPHLSRHSGKPAFRKSATRTTQSAGKSAPASFRSLELALAFVSHNCLNQTDIGPIRTYAPLFSFKVPEDRMLFHDAYGMLVLEPDVQELAVPHEALRTPWNGRKSGDEYFLDAGTSLIKSRGGWMGYLASYRTIAGILGADDAFYPTTPNLQRERKAEFGGAHELYPGLAAYSPDALGNVTVRGRTLGQDGFYTPCIMQYSSVASYATDKMAQAFLSPFYGMGPYHRDRKFEAATAEGNRSAAPYGKLIPSLPTSHERGKYARLALRAYHTAYVKAYHAR